MVVELQASDFEIICQWTPVTVCASRTVTVCASRGLAAARSAPHVRRDGRDRAEAAGRSGTRSGQRAGMDAPLRVPVT